MNAKKNFKTVFISDIHLWNPKNQWDKLVNFLKSITFENLIIVWDFIDFWQLNTFWKRAEKDTNTLHYINQLSNDWINIIYLQWNHDKKIECSQYIRLQNISIMKNLLYKTSKWKIFYITHWDSLDWINNNNSKIWKIWSYIYGLLLRIESIWNKKAILPWETSIAEKIESWIKIHRFPKDKLIEKIKKFTKWKNYDWIILWHFHQASHHNIDWLEYFNSWDWLNNCSAVIEDNDWNLDLFFYKNN